MTLSKKGKHKFRVDFMCVIIIQYPLVELELKCANESQQDSVLSAHDEFGYPLTSDHPFD